MNDIELFKAIEGEARKRWFPKLKVAPKSESKLMSAINWLFNLLKSAEHKDWFLNRFWTTIIYTILHPIQYVTATLRNWWTLLHELIHCFQVKKWTPPVFSYLYLWPLSQGGLLALTCWLPVFWASGWKLAIWIPAWAIIGGLHFIPKLPDPWRAHWELQAYCVSMYTYNEMNGGIPDSYIEQLVANFTDMSYYQMASSPDRIRKKLVKIRDQILAGTHPVKDHEVIKLYHELKAS